MKPLTYLINCAPEGAPAEWHQSGEEFKDSEDVVAVIAYSEYQAQAKRIEELLKTNNEQDLLIKSLMSTAGLLGSEAQVTEIESLRKQSEEMLTAMRRAVLALAFAAEKSRTMQDDYQALSNAIAKAVASKNGE